MACFVLVFFIIEVLISRNQAESYWFDIGQLIFLLCTFYFNHIPESENSKTYVKDFLTGPNFNHREKCINSKKFALAIFG